MPNRGFRSPVCRKATLQKLGFFLILKHPLYLSWGCFPFALRLNKRHPTTSQLLARCVLWVLFFLVRGLQKRVSFGLAHTVWVVKTRGESDLLGDKNMFSPVVPARKMFPT